MRRFSNACVGTGVRLFMFMRFSRLSVITWDLEAPTGARTGVLVSLLEYLLSGKANTRATVPAAPPGEHGGVSTD